MLKRDIQLRFSTNCMAEVPSLKRVYSGNVTRKLIAEPSKATQRTARACSSRPSANKTTPKKIGVQMARLNNPIFLVSLLEPDEIGHQHEHTDDHGQRIVVEVARLHPAHHTRGAAHQLPGAVHHEPVDQPQI